MQFSFLERKVVLVPTPHRHVVSSTTVGSILIIARLIVLVLVLVLDLVPISMLVLGLALPDLILVLVLLRSVPTLPALVSIYIAPQASQGRPFYF